MNEFWDKARRAAAGARILFAAGDYEGSASRAYYAMFNAARALLIATGSAGTGKRHASVLRSFSDQFVRHGSLDEAVGRALRHASDVRHLADSRGAALGEEQARVVVEEMELFMAAEAEVARLEQRREL